MYILYIYIYILYISIYIHIYIYILFRKLTDQDSIPLKLPLLELNGNWFKREKVSWYYP